jgi:hypothetical protein
MALSVSKVGAWFRDCLSHRYKSSSKAKHAKKMAKRVSVDHLLVDPHAVLNFPSNFAAQIEAHDKKSKATRAKAQDKAQMKQSDLDFPTQAFYDIDDLSLVPFDRLEP